MSSSVEVKKDIAELEQLMEKALRPKVKDVLQLEIRKLQTTLIQLEAADKNKGEVPAPVSSQNIAQRCYQVKLNNYAWDQTNEFLKLYVTLKNVQTVPEENVSCNFTVKSVEMKVKGLENKDYSLTIKNLLEEIKPKSSTWKVKNDMVIVSMAKVKPENWSHITGLEKKASESKVPKFDDDDSKDPSANFMLMMKKMYDSGDDEMKRTIAKAWTEGADKRSEALNF